MNTAPRQVDPDHPDGASWRASGDMTILRDAIEPRTHSALEQLGPSPFPRGGFPVLGLLASVYEHVSERARRALR